MIDIKKFSEKVMRNPNLLHIDKCILFDLYSYAGNNKSPYPSHQTLATNQGVSARYIRERLKVLKVKGWISWKKRGYSKTNLYSLNKELYFRNDNSLLNSSSAQQGTTAPVQSGSDVPPNKSKEENKLSSSSYALRLFEVIADKKCHANDRRKLQELCDKYSEASVIEAIDEASTRKTSFLSVSYIALILGDRDKERQERKKISSIKPVFVPCNTKRCNEGKIYQDNSQTTYVLCNCKLIYNKELEDWNKEFGNKL